jgi:hypothetical protein
VAETEPTRATRPESGDLELP